jgi:hypothetical protein
MKKIDMAHSFTISAWNSHDRPMTTSGNIAREYTNVSPEYENRVHTTTV